MAQRDMFHRFSPKMSLDIAVRTADANGAGIDLAGFEGALVLGIVGAEGVTLSGTDKIELELEESDDDSTYTDVAAADMVGGEKASGGKFATFDANAEAPAVQPVAYVGSKRYIRGVANFSGTHATGTPVGIAVVRGFARHASPAAGDTQKP